MTAPPPGTAQATHPNPPRPQAPAQGGSGIGRVLGVLSWLITYGKDLADKLRQTAGAPAFAPFGTTDLAGILRRVARGLMLAAALHERLARRAARGRDITPPPLRSPKPRKPATPRPSTKLARTQATPDDVATLPTPREIAALLRRRPLGAVIAEICCDLGIVPGDLEPALWDKLSLMIIEYGGSLDFYLTRTADRLFGPLPRRRTTSRRAANFSPSPRESESAGPVQTPEPPPPVPLALATGPP